MGTPDTISIVDGQKLTFGTMLRTLLLTSLLGQVRMPDPKAWQAPHFGSMHLGREKQTSIEASL